tara:strand:+ start:16646 stop:17053 length:408 start_codon:yes stop_codon:yes gene_type:complete
MQIKSVSTGKWHPTIRFQGEDGCNYTIANNPGGCGALILYNWTSMRRKSIKDIHAALDIVFDLIKSNKSNDLSTITEDIYGKYDVGGVSLTIGQTFYDSNFEKAILEYGFKLCSEYKNPRHGAGYTQRMYLWVKE